MNSQAKKIANKLIDCFKRGNKVLVMGNGGSAQMSNHLVAELVHEGYPAISLNSDTIIITALANDYSFKEAFAKQIKALGKNGDILIGLSTSGKSKNILSAYKVAKKIGLEIIDFPKRGNTSSCQEYQLRLLHQVWKYLK